MRGRSGRRATRRWRFLAGGTLGAVALAVGAALVVGERAGRVPRYPDGFPPSLRIVSDFASPTDALGRRRPRLHQGIDVQGPAGLRIIAIAPGWVLEVTADPYWGPTVVVDHGMPREPLVALYGHLGRVAVRAGDFVRRGDPVGWLGEEYRRYPGAAGVRHLHLQLGSRYRTGDSDGYYGHMRFLEDGFEGRNPHPLWADGPWRVSCWDPDRRYPPGVLTYPVRCGS